MISFLNLTRTCMVWQEWYFKKKSVGVTGLFKALQYLSTTCGLLDLDDLALLISFSTNLQQTRLFSVYFCRDMFLPQGLCACYFHLWTVLPPDIHMVCFFISFGSPPNVFSSEKTSFITLYPLPLNCFLSLPNIMS